MKDQALISYKELMLALHQLCLEQQTGTMFIATNDNHAIQFVLHAGNIVACRSGVKEGDDAIQWIKTIQSGRYSFSKDFLGDGKLVSLSVSTDSLLKELVGKGIQPSSEQELTAAEFSAAKALIEEELTDTIGPIASIICEDCFEEVRAYTLSELVILIDKVTIEVEEGKREQFKKQLMGKLKITAQSEGNV